MPALAIVSLLVQYLEYGIDLKVGATILFFIAILVFAAIDRLRWAPVNRPQRHALTTWLGILYLTVVLFKSLIWNGLSTNLTASLASHDNTCIDLETTPQHWLSVHPGRAIDNWALPSLTIALQDTAPDRYLLTSAQDCKRLIRSKKVAIAPWESIPVSWINCRSKSPKAYCRKYETQVQKMYLAYYGRPGDSGGIEYWDRRLAKVGGTWIADLVSAFGSSAEYLDRFGEFDDATLIDNLYRQLFNRPAEPLGKGFYTDLLNGANVSGLNPDLRETTLAEIALDIASGAAGQDRKVLDNKLSVALYFTASIEETGRSYGKRDLVWVTRMLASVGDSDASITEAQATIDRFAAIKPQSP